MTTSPFASIPELVAEVAAGRMVVLVDDESRENEGDVILAADCVTPEAINFMARFCRGLICLTLTAQRCDALQLPPMVSRNGTKHGTAFTVSIEAATGVDTGISAADRARTIQVAVDPAMGADALVQPGHVFPLRAAEGGVMMRAGHTEAGCDLARMAGRTPAAVICEIMKDDGTMARVPDLIEFAKTHQLKLGTIADLIRYRSQTEHLVELKGKRPLTTAQGTFDLQTFQDHFGRVHLALTLGQWKTEETVLVRVHEPLSMMDVLDTQNNAHSWPLASALQTIQAKGQGVVLLLNADEANEGLLDSAVSAHTKATRTGKTQEDELRTYGVGAQILRSLGVGRMQIMGKPRKFPSMSGYGLHIESFLQQE